MTNNNNQCDAAVNYGSIHQLNKKEDGKERKPIFPVTPIQAVYDARTGASLEAILAQFNSIYVQYQGTPEATRNIIPEVMRRAGLTITYMDMESNTITERANSAVQKDNDHWGLDVNWSRVDELSLSGDISVSSKGTWIINGKDTGVKALGPKGDTGLTPWLKTIDNKLHFSYDNVTWEPCSENIAAWFRFNATSSDSQAGTIGRIQISRDNKTWQDLSPEFRNFLRVQGYVATTSALPKNQVVGTIYGVGPTYAADDTEQTNPIYRLHVWNGSSWVDNGRFTSIAAGVVQETGDSETEVMSQKAVSEKLFELGSKIDNNITIQSIIEDASIDHNYIIIGGAGIDRNLYIFPVRPNESIIVSNGDLYGWFSELPIIGSKTNEGRYVGELNDTELIVPSGVKYIAIRWLDKPKVSYNIESLSNKIESLEDKNEKLNKDLEDVEFVIATTVGKEVNIITATTSDSNYQTSERFYSICNVSKGSLVHKVSLLSPITSYSPTLIFAKVKETSAEIVASFTLSIGNGESYIDNVINYECKDDLTMFINAFYFKPLETNNNVPIIISRLGTIVDTGRVDLGVSVKVYIGGELQKLGNSLSSIYEESSDVAMFENIGFCGDSYMAGMIVVSENPTVTAENTNLSWGKILERTHGIKASIFAKGGVSVVDATPNAGNFLSDSKCLPLLLDSEPKNLYVISLGHNDCYISEHQSSYGKDLTKDEFIAEFKANYNIIISSIQNHAPKAKIIICMQSKPYVLKGWGADINKAIKEIAESNGLPYLNPEDDKYLSSSIYVSSMVHDHPTFAGYAGIAKAFDRLFCKATIDFWDYFKGYTGL